MADVLTVRGRCSVVKILFVGINPHPGSWDRCGVPFSNNKMFWYLLNRAGLLQEAEHDLKNDQLPEDSTTRNSCRNMT